MGCCCGKKQEVLSAKSVKEEHSIDVQNLIRLHGSSITEWIVQENEEEIQKILKLGFPPDIEFDAGGYKSTILILTIAFKKDSLTKLVLNYPQNLNVIVGPNNDSALIMAISHRNIPIIELLLQKGANPNILGPAGKTPLELATKQMEQCQNSEDIQGLDKMVQIQQIFNKKQKK